MLVVVWQYAFQWRSFDFKIFKPTLGAISEAWNRVSIIAPVKKFGRARLSTDFRGEETWRTSSESICKFSLTYCCFTIKHLRKGSICPTSKFWSGVKCCQDIIKVREWIPHIGPVTKVIPLKLFLDVVPSSSAEIIRVLRRSFREESVYRYVASFHLISKERKASNAVGMFLWYFDYKQGSFGSRYVLIHFET